MDASHEQLKLKNTAYNYIIVRVLNIHTYINT